VWIQAGVVSHRWREHGCLNVLYILASVAAVLSALNSGRSIFVQFGDHLEIAEC